MALTLICLIVVYLFKLDLFLIFGMVFLVATMTSPIVLRPFAFIWLNLTHYMGIVMSNALLAIIFFMLVVPIGMILKLIGRDTMLKKKWKDGSNTSIMVERNHIYTSSDIKNPF